MPLGIPTGRTLGATIDMNGRPLYQGVATAFLAMVLEGVDIPVSGIALLLGVDRILDMSRTVVNVTGDLTACRVLTRWMPPTSPEVTAGDRSDD